MPANAPMPIPCFVCGAAALLADETKTHADFDCPECGRLRVTGRAMFVFTPQAMRTFDRSWLSSKARAIAETRQDGNRRRVDDPWLHHWRLVTLLMADHAISEADAEHRLRRHPDADMTNETVLALVGRDLGPA